MSRKDVVKSRGLALFDFDGTITWIDTAVPFFLYVTPKMRLITSIPAVSVFLLSAIMGKSTFDQAKEQIIFVFLNGMSRRLYEKKCSLFSKKIPFFVRRVAARKIAWHILQGHTCVIVSRSLGDYIMPWAKTVGFSEVLSSKLQKTKTQIIGNFEGENLGGVRKVVAIKKQFGNLAKFDVYAYGNSKNDLPMLALADSTKQFYKKMW